MIFVIYFVVCIIFLLGFKSISDEKKLEINKLKSELINFETEIEQLKNKKEVLEKELSLKETEKENLIKKIKEHEFNIQVLREENEDLRTIRARLTAYSPLDNRDGQQAEGDSTRTSIGKRVSRGIVAADPKKLPYGTKLEIPNWGTVEVGDTGGALRKDNKNIRIDLFHETYNQAMKFGVQDIEVKILEWGGQ